MASSSSSAYLPDRSQLAALAAIHQDSAWEQAEDAERQRQEVSNNKRRKLQDNGSTRSSSSSNEDAAEPPPPTRRYALRGADAFSSYSDALRVPLPPNRSPDYRLLTEEEELLDTYMVPRADGRVFDLTDAVDVVGYISQDDVLQLMRQWNSQTPEDIAFRRRIIDALGLAGVRRLRAAFDAKNAAAHVTFSPQWIHDFLDRQFALERVPRYRFLRELSGELKQGTVELLLDTQELKLRTDDLVKLRTDMQRALGDKMKLAREAYTARAALRLDEGGVDTLMDGLFNYYLPHSVAAPVTPDFFGRLNDTLTNLQFEMRNLPAGPDDPLLTIATNTVIDNGARVALIREGTPAVLQSLAALYATELNMYDTAPGADPDTERKIQMNQAANVAPFFFGADPPVGTSPWIRDGMNALTRMIAEVLRQGVLPPTSYFRVVGDPDVAAAAVDIRPVDNAIAVGLIAALQPQLEERLVLLRGDMEAALVDMATGIRPAQPLPGYISILERMVTIAEDLRIHSEGTQGKWVRLTPQTMISLTPYFPRMARSTVGINEFPTNAPPAGIVHVLVPEADAARIRTSIEPLTRGVDTWQGIQLELSTAGLARRVAANQITQVSQVAEWVRQSVRLLARNVALGQPFSAFQTAVERLGDALHNGISLERLTVLCVEVATAKQALGGDPTENARLQLAINIAAVIDALVALNVHVYLDLRMTFVFALARYNVVREILQIVLNFLAGPVRDRRLASDARWLSLSEGAATMDQLEAILNNPNYGTTLAAQLNVHNTRMITMSPTIQANIGAAAVFVKRYATPGTLFQEEFEAGFVTDYEDKRSVDFRYFFLRLIKFINARDGILHGVTYHSQIADVQIRVEELNMMTQAKEFVMLSTAYEGTGTPYIFPRRRA